VQSDPSDDVAVNRLVAAIAPLSRGAFFGVYLGGMFVAMLLGFAGADALGLGDAGAGIASLACALGAALGLTWLIRRSERRKTTPELEPAVTVALKRQRGSWRRSGRLAAPEVDPAMCRCRVSLLLAADDAIAYASHHLRAVRTLFERVELAMCPETSAVWLFLTPPRSGPVVAIAAQLSGELEGIVGTTLQSEGPKSDGPSGLPLFPAAPEGDNRHIGPSVPGRAAPRTT
jgi:hypothetical protein